MIEALMALALSTSTQQVDALPDLGDMTASTRFATRAVSCGYLAEVMIGYNGFDEPPFNLRETQAEELFALGAAVNYEAFRRALPEIEGDYSVTRYPFLQGVSEEAGVWFFVAANHERSIQDGILLVDERYEPSEHSYPELVLEIFEEENCRDLPLNGAQTLADGPLD